MNDILKRKIARILVRDYGRYQNDSYLRHGYAQIRVAERNDGSAYASVTEFRTDYLDNTLAWFSSQADAEMFIVRQLGLPALENAHAEWLER